MTDVKELQKKSLRSWCGEGAFICEWFICGFFPAQVRNAEPPPNLFDKKISDNWRKDWLSDWGGVEGIVGGLPKPCAEQGGKSPAEIEWMHVECSEYSPVLSLQSARRASPALDSVLDRTNPGDMQWYALALVECDSDCELEMNFSVWDGSIVHLNGKEVFEEHSWHHVLIDMEKIRLPMKKGVNTLLFKNERDGLVARLSPATGWSADWKAPVALGLEDAKSSPEISGDWQIRRCSLASKPSHSFNGGSESEFLAWKQSFREIYRKIIGKTFDSIPGGKTLTRTLGETKTAWGVRRLVEISGGPFGEKIPAFILVPDDSIRNGKTILLVHGHGMTWRIVAGERPRPPVRAAQIGPDTDNYAELLAMQGFLTATFCLRGFEERGDLKSRTHLCSRYDAEARMLGFSLIGLHIHDIHCMADALCEIPGVNPSKIGISGLSGGATMTCYAAAYDDRFAAAASFCGVFSMLDKIFDGGCGMQNLLGLYEYGDMDDVLAMIAPRPLLIAQGRYDACFNIPRTRSIFEGARRAYSSLGKTAMIEFKVTDLGHQYEPKLAGDFFRKHP